ncbi:uncharacterized protein LOC128552808 [Mercenaria mercenaria]|uniref:uncharacterized protein LOC128552808 n=1 Tax=Mercenaria mercenaria TaxID=6596 RepID=UPI00234EF2A9|nr:uncharacterized protein LOC128552808 [Mercenaria mercenaria]
MTVTANIVPTISGTIQRNSMSKSLSSHLENLLLSVELADTIPLKQESSTIDVLIGNDYYLDIVLPNRLEIQPGLYLLASKLGWILTGRANEKSQEDSGISMFVMTYGKELTRNSVFASVDASMEVQPDLQTFWDLESIGITNKIEVSNDEKAMQRFRYTLKFENGRYQVTWPWREEVFNLPVNRQLANGRLK